jgi:hypothetical protein
MTYLALKHAGATDWNTGLGLSLAHQGHLHYVEYHHIFPRAVLRKADYDKSEINEIANMAFISGRANRRISAKPPVIYLASVIENRGENALQTQAIPLNTSMWATERYREFLERRREMLAQAVNDFVAASVAKGHATGAPLLRNSQP